VGWLNLRNDSDELMREVFVGEVPTRCRIAESLAGIPALKEINEPAPWPAIEGPDVSPYWEARKDAISLALQEDSLAVGLDLDCANRDITEKEVGKDASSDSRKKM
jgi:hypothetical protein